MSDDRVDKLRRGIPWCVVTGSHIREKGCGRCDVCKARAALDSLAAENAEYEKAIREWAKLRDDYFHQGDDDPFSDEALALNEAENRLAALAASDREEAPRCGEGRYRCDFWPECSHVLDRLPASDREAGE